MLLDGVASILEKSRSVLNDAALSVSTNDLFEGQESCAGIQPSELLGQPLARAY